MSSWDDKQLIWKNKRAELLKDQRSGMSYRELAQREGVGERTIASNIKKAKRDERNSQDKV